jgi:hypothetical protein
VPLDDLNALLGGLDGGKNCEEAFDTMRMKLNREVHGVDKQPEDYVVFGSAGITFEEPLNGSGLLMVGRICKVKCLRPRLTSPQAP